MQPVRLPPGRARDKRDVMSDLVVESVRHLNQLLPLKARQDQLPPALRALHRAVIESLVKQGRPPSGPEIAAIVGTDQVDAALERLAADDLVVLSPDRREIRGAYPVTADVTKHEVRVNGHHIHAMCAVDALSVGPMFGLSLEIDSRCRQTGTAVHIEQQAERIVSASPSTVQVGVRWQAPQGSAAASLCMEMVFLRDADAAAAWHQGDLQRHTVYTLDQAVQFGAGFFKPLL